MPSDAKPKLSKPTITLARKGSTGGSASPQSFGERKFSTRAKDAARRDGRTLFDAVKPAEVPGTEPRAARGHAETADASVRRRRATEPGDANRSARSPEPRRPDGSSRGSDSGRAAGQRTGSRRPAAVGSEVRRSTEPRRGGNIANLAAHRLHHQLSFLWRFHRTHHSAPYMGMAMASRQNFIYTVFFPKKTVANSN